ncbi:hypothetical protein HY449_02905 [Candidatus Pacearchaeota archaeon]|nr:hypothetical protein [Candidatus Pacearchaeota archaeon]
MSTQKDKSKVRASFHGHILADYGQWWRRQFGIEGKNLADVAAERCIEKGIDVYAITNESVFSNFEKISRFEQIFQEADSPSLKGKYKVGRIGNAFVMQSRAGKVIFLNGKSIRVSDDGRTYELLTFGSSEIPDGMNFKDTSSYLHDNGFLSVAEHPFAGGHHGAISEEKILELWENRYIDAVEHNGKIAVPEFLSLLPVQEFKNYSRACNRRLEELADKYRIPMIANDDSDGISHIGTAYTEFDRNKIRLNSDENIIRDLNALIVNGDFKTHNGYLNFLEFMRYAGWILSVKERGLGLKEKYEQKLRQKES